MVRYADEYSGLLYNYHMKKVKIIGIRDSNYKALYDNLKLALRNFKQGIEIEEINDVDHILEYDISSIPALVMDEDTLLQMNNHIAGVEEVTHLIESQLNKPMRIKNILVPVDFSDVSQNAYAYALELATELDAQLKVVHVMHPHFETSSPEMVETIDKIVQMREEDLTTFCATVPGDTMDQVVAKEMVEQEVLIGFAADKLISLSKTKEVDMIVMGTTGQGDVIKKLLGGVAVDVAKNAYCPVWLIPADCKFRGLKQVVYASNYESADQRMLENLFNFADRFEARVRLVHISERKKKRDPQLESILLDQLFRQRMQQSQVQVEYLESDKVWEGLYEFTSINTADLVVMVTRHRSFLQRLFHKSQTAEVIRNSQLPILVMHIDD